MPANDARAHRFYVGACAAALSLVAPMALATPSAQYTVRFDATWSASTHPVDFPAGAHWSPLIGGTHDAFVSFWSTGALATPGIRDMAERGRTTPLDTEVDAAITAGHAGSVVRGGDIATSTGWAQADFQVTLAFPRVTVVTMIAPSPDWFVGVSGLDLHAGGEWAERLVVPLFAFDAGTDSGPTYASPNQPTVPAMPIAANPAPPFQNGAPLGLLTFTRTDAPIFVPVPALGAGVVAVLGIVLGGLGARGVRGRHRASKLSAGERVAS